MSVRARALFFASLALVVGPLALPGRGATASTPEAAPVLGPVHVHQGAHPATHGTRNWLLDRSADRDADAPFTPSQSTSHPVRPAEVRMAGPSVLPYSTDRLLLLPPSRAPPALS